MTAAITINSRPPSMHGTMVRAQNTEARCVAWDLIVPQDDAHNLVSGWVIYAPYAHPMWSYYTIECIHLRSEGLMIYLPGATHEFVLWALDPKFTPVLNGPNHPLEPKNFASQFVALDDQDATRIVRAAVQDVIDGTLNPDPDNLSQWRDRFGDNMLKG